jgi:hypothetical protein
MADRRIWRFPLPITDRVRIDMPEGAQPLSVAVSRTGGEDLDLWAIVNPDNTPGFRTFLVVGTGNPVPADCGRFIGTVATHGGALVWHVFEAKEGGR